MKKLVILIFASACAFLSCDDVISTAYNDRWENSDTRAVCADMEALEPGYASGDSAEEITQDISLPTSGESGTVITWVSDTPGIIAVDGTVTRPGFFQGDAEVTLTATVSKGKESRTVEFKVIIKASPIADAECVREDKEKLTVGYNGSDSAENVTQNVVLKTSGSNGTVITWSSDTLGVITVNGIVARPLGTGNASVTLTATISKGAESDTKLFNLTVIQLLSVIYNAGNGNPSGTVPLDSNGYDMDDIVTVLDNTGDLRGDLIRDGIRQRFVGWNTNPSSTTAEYIAGDTFIITGTTILYAIYTTGGAVIAKTGPAGGWIFYDAGSVQGWGRYLESAPNDQDYEGNFYLKWGCFGTGIDGADGTAVGTGEQNTIDIEAGCSTAGTAADVCANLVVGVYDDWFLPSKDELNLMYTNLHLNSVGGFADYYYWSSSENDDNGAWYQYFLNGDQGFESKLVSFRVRAARAF